jgi:hypothetical protein
MPRKPLTQVIQHHKKAGDLGGFIMRKICLVFTCFSCFALSVFTQEPVSVFHKYRLLHPEIDNQDKTAAWRDRRVYYHQTTGFRNEHVSSYDPKTGEVRMLPISVFEQYPVYFSETLWDPNTKMMYACFIETPYNRFSELNGWYILSFTAENDFKAQKVEGFPGMGRNPPVRKLENGHILYSNNKSFPYPKKGEEDFRIIDSNTGETLWFYTGTKLDYSSNTNIYWVSGAWLLQKTTGLADVEFRLFNYLTGMTRHNVIYPEIIMGYGDGYIAVTSQELKGITVVDPSHNIIFQDKTFELTAMVDGKYTIPPAKFVSFGYIDLPYVYYDVISRFGPLFTECSVVLDLHTYNTYMTSERWKLLGVSYD